MTDLPDKLDEIFIDILFNAQTMDTKVNKAVFEALERAESKINQLRLQDRINAMEQAKSRVLRRTEIPADARNPTRDAIVILGEEIAHIITKDIEALKTREEQ